jgi:hypothetical protein
MNGNPFLPFIPPLTQWFSSLFSSDEPEPKPKLTTFGQMKNEYDTARSSFANKMKANDRSMYDISKTIPLSQGRFKGASIPVDMVNDAVSSAKRYNVDPMLMVSLIGRESTFGSGNEKNMKWANYSAPKPGSNYATFSKKGLLSGWNVAESYQPYNFMRFLADKKAPGISVTKDKYGWNYKVDNQKLVDKYLEQNPDVYDDYAKMVKSTPRLGNLNSFDLAAKFIKEKGLSKYNPGDKTYVKDIKSDMSLLRSDPKLMSHMRKLGYR